MAKKILAAAALALACVTDSRVGAQVELPAPGVHVLRDLRMHGRVWPAQVDRDGKTDLLASSTPVACDSGVCFGSVQVSTGRGDGSFNPPVVSSVRGDVLGAADFNADRYPDVIAVSPTDRGLMVVILPGTGTTSFGPAVGVALGDEALSGDVDGDGTRDLVVRGGSGIEVYPGNGDFRFGPPVSLIDTQGLSLGTLADLNRDGRRDLVTLNPMTLPWRLPIFFNQGSLVFARVDQPIDGSDDDVPTDVIASDVDRDGSMDLLTSAGRPETWSGLGAGALFVLLGNGNGTFRPGGGYLVPPGATELVAGDFNRDGILDVVTGNQSAIVRDDCTGGAKTWDSVSVFIGLGNGAFRGPWNFSIGDQSTSDPSGPATYRNTLVSLNTNDLDHDGDTDLIASHGAVLMNIPAVPNRAPTVDAGRDQVVSDRSDVLGLPRASDPDEDLLTWTIRDGTGSVVADYPNACWPVGLGTNTFTVTVHDGRGKQATDTIVYDVIPHDESKGTFEAGREVGNVARAGDDSYDPTTDTYTVSGSGADIWGVADEFHYMFATAVGDFQVTALVNSIEQLHAWTKGGIMIREHLDPGARHASLFVTPSHGVAFQRRPVEHGTSVHTTGPPTTAPVWVHLQRTGDVITASWRKSTTDCWTVIGRQTLTDFAPNVVVGLAVTSHADGAVAAASFSHVRVGVGGWAPPTGNAIGAASGSVTTDDGVVATVTGRGADIWNASDAFFYANERTCSDFTITARVRSLTNTHPWAKAGVMVRQDLATGSRHVMTVVTPGKGISMQYRPTPGGPSLQAANVPGAAPGWVRLAKRGTTLTSSWSKDGVIWTTLATVNLPFTAPFYVGLPVTSHTTSSTATAVFDDVWFSYE